MKRQKNSGNHSENSVHSVKKYDQLVSLLLDWFSSNARDLPWRRTKDPYAIWVSEIMLQQTQVRTVIPYWERWMRELPTIEAAAKASPDKLHKLWEGLGYYTRVRNLQKAAQVILEQHDGTFPHTHEEVLALPGIGRYTAGAICSIAFNQPTPILDGNVIRVLTRVFGIPENPKKKETNAKLWKIAEELVNQAAASRWGECLHEPVLRKTARGDARPTDHHSCSALNESLMELGALICTPRGSQCLICPLKNSCVAYKEGRVDELPNLGKRETATARRFIAFVIEHDGKFLVRQRPEGVVNAHLWEFPNVEVNGSKVSARDTFQIHFQIPSPQLQPLRTVKHSITRYRITLEAFHARLSKRPAKPDGKWLLPSEFDSIAFSSAHKKLASFAADCILSSR